MLYIIDKYLIIEALEAKPLSFVKKAQERGYSWIVQFSIH